jgi:hypothetical protein
MAYLKTWSRRSSLELELQVPELLAGGGIFGKIYIGEILRLMPWL